MESTYDSSHDSVQVVYKTDLGNVDWAEMKSRLIEDRFDNGRTVAQYETSFRNSDVVCLAYVDGHIAGTVRALSDGVCNAYIVDVWTYTPYRRRGVARRMMEIALEKLPGQHVYLWTDDRMDFYTNIGFEREASVGFAKVVGQWLKNG